LTYIFTLHLRGDAAAVAVGDSRWLRRISLIG
jgi:hypothetical protein